MCALLSNIKSGKSGTSKDIKTYLDNLVFTYGTKILEYIGQICIIIPIMSQKTKNFYI